MKEFIKIVISVIACVILCGCGTTSLRAKFVPLPSLPQGYFRDIYEQKIPFDIVVMPGLPTTGQYIELGYITVDEGAFPRIKTELLTKNDMTNMVRAEAAEVGADAVIKFSISGEHPDRVAVGIAIKYEKR